MTEVSAIFWTMPTRVEPGFRLLAITAGHIGFPVRRMENFLPRQRERESRGKRNEIEMEDRETTESDTREKIKLTA